MPQLTDRDRFPLLLVAAFAFLLVVAPFLQVSFSPPHHAGMRGLIILGLCLLGGLLLRRAEHSPQLSLVGWSLVGIWVAGTLLSLTAAAGPMAAVVRQLEWYAGLALFLVIGTLGDADRERVVRLFLGSLIGASLFFISYFFSTWLRLDAASIAQWWESPFPFADIRFYGHFALAAALAGFLLPTMEIRHPGLTRGWPVLRFILLTLLVAALLWTEGRAAIAGFVVGVATLLLCTRGALRWRLAAYAAGSTVLAWLVTARPWVTDGAVAKTIGVDRDIALTNPNGRLEIWEIIWIRLQEQPWLGYGPNGYHSMAERPLHTTSTHNTVLQAWSDWGFPIGTLFLAVFGWLSLRFFLRGTLGKVEPRQAILIAILGALTVNGAVSATLFHQPAMTISMLAFALLFWSLLSPAENRIPAFGLVGARRGLAAALAGFALLAGLHLVNIRNQLERAIPSVNAWQVRLLQVYPSYTPHAGRWVTAWAESDPTAALAMARWLQTRSEEPWLYYALEADLLAGAGDAAGAEAAHRVAESLRPSHSWTELRQRLEGYRAASP